MNITKKAKRDLQEIRARTRLNVDIPVSPNHNPFKIISMYTRGKIDYFRSHREAELIKGFHDK